MTKIYRYKGVSPSGANIQGSVFAENEDLAYGKVKKLGFKVTSIVIDWNATVSHVTNHGFDQRQLVLFYRQLALRLRKADNIDTVLRDSANFISDPALKLAVIEASNHSGKNLGDRLYIAGFDRSESEAIGTAIADGGPNGYLIFQTLADTKKKTQELKAKNKKLLREPQVMLGLFYVAFYVVTTYIAPMMLEFMKYQNVKLSKMGLLEPYYHFVQYVAENSITFHILYGAIPIGLYLLMRSKGVVHFFTNWGVIAKLKEVNDMLLLWSQFHLLLMANMNLELAVKKVSAASDSVRFKLAFNGMGRNLADGKSISQSIMNSDFPDQVRLMLSGAAENDLQTGVSDLLEVLSIDQSVLFDQMEMLATAISKVIGVLVIGGLFLIILLPLLMIYKGMAH